MELLKNLPPNHVSYLKCCRKALVNRLSTETFSRLNRDKKNTVRLLAELNKLKLKYNAVFNSSHSYYIILDKQLNVVDFNEAAVKLVQTVFGKQIKIGEPIANYLNDELSAQLLQNCRRALAGETLTVERKLYLVDNQPTWWMAEYSPAYDVANHIAGLVFSAIDITTRKNYEEKIELQNAKLRAISLMQLPPCLSECAWQVSRSYIIYKWRGARAK